MINQSLNKLIEILIASPTILCAGYSGCYAPGWPGLTRVRTNEAWDNTGIVQTGMTAPTEGWINLYDRPYSKNSEETKPGIYIGINTHEFTVSDDGKQVSSGHQIVHKDLDVPIVIAVSDVDQFVCRDKRNQLRDNVLKVILQNMTAPNAWWALHAPGEAGGGNLAEHAWMTETGQGTTGRVEAFSVIPVRAKIRFTANTFP